MHNWRYNHINIADFPYYEGNDLGVTVTREGISVKIWAPKAQEVSFFIYRESQGGKPIRKDSLRFAGHGCWGIQLKGSFAGLYYTFKVRNKEWMNETPGVEARAVGINGKRGLFFIPEETDPENWGNDQPVSLVNPVDAILYEIHVRDFSVSPDSGMINKGKYLAFTEKGTKAPNGLATGIDHLKELGITHVHLLPVADFCTVDENFPDQKYNWGYDPLNFNAPEGSYTANPDSTSRITEFKQLVMSLHEAGIGVVLDVVYNHTGFTSRSWFNQTVPGYYYRQNPDGSFSDATGCGNEVASERPMVRKYIIDSVCYWAKEYHVDGFRFDLMGVLDIETMQAIRNALNKLRPGILLYGEGWSAASSPLEEKYRALKVNLHRLPGIACFNDDFRDAVKGNNFIGPAKGFISGKTLSEEPVKFGVAAACNHPQIVYAYVGSSSFPWATEPHQTVNYVSAHDNLTLFDKLQISNPGEDLPALKRMQLLAGALVLTSQGIPFLHAGIEFCRTKHGDHNSYKSPDQVNQLSWNRKKEFLDVFRYFKGLIALRKSISAFRMRHSDDIRKYLHFSPEYQPGVVSYTIRDFPGEAKWESIHVVFNALKEAITVNLPYLRFWTILAEDGQIALDGIRSFEGNEATVLPVSMSVFVSEHSQ